MGRGGQGLLHRGCEWGIEHMVQCLVEHNANVNAKLRESVSFTV